MDNFEIGDAVEKIRLDTKWYYPEVEHKLRDLDERALRDDVLPALLPELEFVDIRSRHGAREEGKDLLAWRYSLLGTKDWVGFVVKRGDLNAQVASTSGVRTVLHQVEQVLDHEITDPLSSNQSVVRECWVITNGDIPGHALDEVAATLRRHHLEKAIRWLDAKTLSRLFCERLRKQRIEEVLGIKLADASALKEDTNE
jgi:hypothetical protein